MRVGLITEGTMELVAMELKQSGYFLARTLSYEARRLLMLYNITAQCTPNALNEAARRSMALQCAEALPRPVEG